jgi:hypothetical protein
VERVFGWLLSFAAGPLAQLVEQGTLNPKVEGSNPSRPIRPERIRDPKRQSAQTAREIPKADITRRIPRSPPIPEREGALT